MSDAEHLEMLAAINDRRAKAMEAVPRGLSAQEYIRATDEIFRQYHAALFEWMELPAKILALQLSPGPMITLSAEEAAKLNLTVA